MARVLVSARFLFAFLFFIQVIALSQKKSAPAKRRPVTSDLPPDPRSSLAEEARRALDESRWSDAENLCRKGLVFGTDAQLEELLGEAALRLWPAP